MISWLKLRADCGTPPPGLHYQVYSGLLVCCGFCSSNQVRFLTVGRSAYTTRLVAQR